MRDQLDAAGVISLSSGSDDDGAPVAGPSNAKRRAPVPRAARGSAELDVPHTLDDASRTQMHVAIATAPEARVREAFAALVDSVPAVTERVFNMLVADPAQPAAQEQAIAAVAAGAGPYRAPPPPVQPARERAAPVVARWEVCARCGEEYNAVIARLPTECNYHPGRLVVNYNAWPDWDEEVHGEMDTRENRRQFPENFEWSCCRRDGTQAGCVDDEHEPVEGPRRQKRARVR